MSNTYNSNIYEMSEALHDVAKNFLEDEDQETLSLGAYGFLNSLFSKNLSDNIRIAQENANEAFYNRARLPKNVMAYAIEADIENINASPAVIETQLWIMENDLIKLIEEHGGEHAIIDSNCKLYLEEFEFHLDYNLLISKRVLQNKSIYTAKYDISVKNPISDIESPYIPAPYVMKYKGTSYVCFYVKLRQVIKRIISFKAFTNSPIDNKSYEFEFPDQLACFDVFTQEGDTTYHLTPVFSGVGVNTERYFCNYTYIDSNNIRILFDSYSYIPSINTTITTIVQATKGIEGNFPFKGAVDQTLEDTDDYSYLATRILLWPQTDSMNGTDTKSINELKRILPKVFLTRGGLISTPDLNAYFNMINSSMNFLKFFPYIHNQVKRSYYGYYLCKNNTNDIVPTNTVDLTFCIKDLDSNSKYVKANHTYENGSISATRYTFEPGAYIGYEYQIVIDKETRKPIINEDGGYQVALVSEFLYDPNLTLDNRIDLVVNCLMKYYKLPFEEASKTTELRLQLCKLTIAEYYHNYGFLYTFPYKVTISSEGPYVSYYISTMDEQYPISYEKGNSDSPIEMILTTCTWIRPYSGDNANKYTLAFALTQNIDEDYNFIMPVEKALVSTPSYSLLQEFNLNETINGILTGNIIKSTRSNKYSDITELILSAKMSIADVVVATDNSKGNCLYNSEDNTELRYYVVCNTANNTSTEYFTNKYQLAMDTYNAYRDDKDNIYIKLIDSTGKLYMLYDINKNNNLIDKFIPNKYYIESHINDVSGKIETKKYESLIDALHESAKAYYTSQPVKDYTISEAVLGKEGYENIIYDSSKDNENESLYFLQLKNIEGIINIRTIYSAIADKIEKIPSGEDYEYMIFNRYGIIDSEHNTYKEDWEPYLKQSQNDFLNIIDNYNDLDSDLYMVYKKEDFTDNLIIQKYKIIIIDPYTGLASTARYMDTLLASIRYMAKIESSCLLYYANKHDISETIFTDNDEDFLYKYTYIRGEEPLARFAITNDIVYNAAGEPRYKTICKDYVNEDLIPNTIFDIDGIEDNDLFIGNMYKFGDSEILLDHKDPGDINYIDNKEISTELRNYRIDYTSEGNTECTKSFFNLKDVLSLYGSSIFKYNELYRYEKITDGGIGTCLYNGIGFKEKYYLEFLNNKEESNCYVISSRSKLAYVHAKVFNTIRRNIDRGILNISIDPEAYINIYDQFGNKINPNQYYEGIAYAGSEVNKYYLIWNYVGIYVNDELKIFTNIIDALTYGANTGKEFDIVDAEENILYTIDINTTSTLYIQLVSCDIHNIFNIYTDLNEFNKAVKIYDADSYYEVTQSYRLLWNGTKFDAASIYMKDLSKNKRNSWVDTSKITDMAELGLEQPKFPTTEDDPSSGTDVDIVTSDGTVIKTLDDLIKAMMKNPELKVVAILDGGTSDLSYGNGGALLEEEYKEKYDNSVTLYTKDSSVVIDGENLISRVAAILVLYDNKKNPICYYNAQLISVNMDDNYQYDFKVEILTNDVLDKNNKIMINKGTFGTCTACYYPRKNTISDRYVFANTSAKIYTLVKFADKDGSNLKRYGDLGIGNITDLPGLGLGDYTVTNIYNIDNGLDLFEDFTEIVHTTASVKTMNNVDQYFKLSSTPVIGHKYTTNNSKIVEYIKDLKYMKKYVDKSLKILENQYSIDFKLYNTYGPANIYYTTDINEETKEFLDKVNITLHFSTKLLQSADDYTIKYITEDIKNAIDNLDKLSDYHLQNLIADIYKKYENSIAYLEFTGFNNYDSDRKHLLVDTEMEKICVPEFINVNVIITDDSNYNPDISISSI